MKSTCGNYYIGLDHIRAVAVFMVYTWHFIHVHNGHYAPPPYFPLSILTEGHAGVGLFMALSGYLFAKLLDRKKIYYGLFLWNRFIRLVPLLTLVLLIVGLGKLIYNRDLEKYLIVIVSGLIKPTLPNGAWSITVEFHFYLILPFLLYMINKNKNSLFVVVIFLVLGRFLLWLKLGEVQSLAYWTIIGRLDQFLFGIIAFRYRDFIKNKTFLVWFSVFLFLIFYWYFDYLGGFYKTGSYPTTSPIWIYLTPIEGFAFAMLIAWYDNLKTHQTGRISNFIALIGTYSYSIYLFHYFCVGLYAYLIDHFICELTNIYLSLLFAFFSFFLMVPVGYLSFKFVESPFLKYRKIYFLKP